MINTGNERPTTSTPIGALGILGPILNTATVESSDCIAVKILMLYNLVNTGLIFPIYMIYRQLATLGRVSKLIGVQQKLLYIAYEQYQIMYLIQKET